MLVALRLSTRTYSVAAAIAALSFYINLREHPNNIILTWVWKTRLQLSFGYSSLKRLAVCRAMPPVH
jgi:hypothetical protein